MAYEKRERDTNPDYLPATGGRGRVSLTHGCPFLVLPPGGSPAAAAGEPSAEGGGGTAETAVGGPGDQEGA